MAETQGTAEVARHLVSGLGRSLIHLLASHFSPASTGAPWCSVNESGSPEAVTFLKNRASPLFPFMLSFAFGNSEAPPGR